MNDLLRDTLSERAHETEPPPLDLDGIMAAGKRQVSRRRALGILGGAVATAAVAVGTATVVRPRDARPRPAAPAPFTRRQPTYAVGSEIHFGDEVISVAPHTISAFVQTDAGFVFLDRENLIHIADRSGVRSLSRSAWDLTADHRGSLVGWVEPSDDHCESVVYDVAAGRELIRTDAGNKTPPTVTLAHQPRIIAIDGGTAYFDTAHGPYRWDVHTDRGDRLADVGTNIVRAVAAGQIVFQQPLSQRPPAVKLAIGATVSSAAPSLFTGQQAYLSPTAAYLATQPNDAQPNDTQPGPLPEWAGLQIFDTARGDALLRPSSVYRNEYFGQWLDDHTCTVAAVRPDRQVDLLVVDARTRARTIARRHFTDLNFTPALGRFASFVLPTGRVLADLR
jgi:hypothetical protein